MQVQLPPNALWPVFLRGLWEEQEERVWLEQEGGGINNECRSGQYVRVLIPVVVGGSEKTLESVLSGLAPSLWVVGGLRERERERKKD